jgi:hypothetical protein
MKDKMKENNTDLIDVACVILSAAIAEVIKNKKRPRVEFLAGYDWDDKERICYALHRLCYLDKERDKEDPDLIRLTGRMLADLEKEDMMED